MRHHFPWPVGLISRLWPVGLILFAINNVVAAAKPIQVYVKNHCAQEVRVAYNYKSLNGQWITEGWLRIPPGDKLITPIRTRKRVMYFYAENKNKVWDGANLNGSIKRFIVIRPFTYDKRRELKDKNKREVTFFRYKVGRKTESFVGHFRCRPNAITRHLSGANAKGVTIKPMLENH